MPENNTVVLIFPHQLYKDHPAIKPGITIYLVEEYLYFRQFRFHRQKLVLHRASMKNYAEQLQAAGFTLKYVDAMDPSADIRVLIRELSEKEISSIHYADTVDNWLEKRIKAAAAVNHISLVCYPSPNFLNRPEETDDFFARQKKYFQTDFYIAQRKQRGILLDAKGGPLGGKWSFDAENRQKFPKKETVPAIRFPTVSTHVQEAIQYVTANFPHHYGNAQPFFYPTTHAEAEAWLEEFLRVRFGKFGVYEDAIVSREHFLYHSVLTPMLNTGLLQPQQVMDRALACAAAYNIPINSLEGFIRQIMGWREFIRLVYVREGGKQRTTNYWSFTRKIPASFWTGDTGIVPVDNVIKKVLQTGYSHHIERLMILGNFMLLCEFDPDEVYRWFMEMYIDSYDWVMVPNVYGMTQFADGGLMTTKPYISGSNYILKMSDHKAGAPGNSWNEIWDGLFWRFMHVHRSFFQQNPRLGMLLNTFDKMPEQKRMALLHTAELFLQKLGREK